jgi:predicted lysophospholipase L1 biosynthesis ABC-type transport system permease subunit
MAVGASANDIVRRVTVGIFSVVLLGVILGADAGFMLQPYVKSLLYEVTPFDLRALAIPSLTIVLAALLATVPGVIRALRIDPAQMLRAE